jgi:meso-butanediol dehydrogenase / (S,S)-butanediol dehydrogenase / diacetyl reductase
MTMSDDHAVTVVTGAAAGMGRALCTRLARRAQPTVAVDIDEERLHWVDDYATIAACVADIATEEGNAAMVGVAHERFGGVDAAVLNAGAFPAAPLEKLALSDFDRLVAVNLRGAFLGIRAVLPSLRAKGGGAIVVTSSCVSLRAQPNTSVYGATKAGLVNMIQAFAHEIGHENIRINAICPGPTLTAAAADPEFHNHPYYAWQLELTALKRWADPDELAAVMEFLISPAASFITGAAIPVDGGWSAGTQTPPNVR